MQNDFQENKEPTSEHINQAIVQWLALRQVIHPVGAAFLTQKCRLEDKVIKFEIWDTAGQERFHRCVLTVSLSTSE